MHRRMIISKIIVWFYLYGIILYRNPNHVLYQLLFCHCAVFSIVCAFVTYFLINTDYWMVNVSAADGERVSVGRCSAEMWTATWRSGSVSGMVGWCGGETVEAKTFQHWLQDTEATATDTRGMTMHLCVFCAFNWLILFVYKYSFLPMVLHHKCTCPVNKTLRFYDVSGFR